MSKISRKNSSRKNSRKNKKSKNNIKQRSRKNKTNKMRGGVVGNNNNNENNENKKAAALAEAQDKFIALTETINNSQAKQYLLSREEYDALNDDVTKYGIRGDYPKQTYFISTTTPDAANIQFENILKLLMGYSNINKTNYISNVETIDFSNQNITTDKVKQLADVLEINTSLANLNLSGNNINDIDTIKYIAGKLKNNKSLRHLNMSNNNILDEGANLLADLFINKNKNTEDKNNNQYTKNSFGYTREDFRILDLTKNKIINEAAIIDKLKNGKVHLKILLDSNINKTDTQLLQEQISERKKYGYNTISNTHFILNSDNKKGTKKSTYTRNTKFDSPDQQFTNIFNLLKDNNIQKLNLSYSIELIKKTNEEIFKKIAQELAEKLEKNISLIELDISNNEIFKEEIDERYEGKKNNEGKKIMTKYDIGFETMQSFSKALKVNKTLKVLNMSGNNMSDKCAEELAEALKENKTLTELNISDNNMSEVGKQALSTALIIRNNTDPQLKIIYESKIM